jgi:hypothetical protein
MNPWRMALRLGGAVLSVTLLGWVCLAAPILPHRGKVNDELLSLARLERLNVKFEDDHEILRKAGYSSSRTRSKLQKQLADAGIEVVDEATEDLPMLVVAILIEGHPRYNDLVSYTYCLALEQNAVIERIDRRLHVPTYVFVFGDIATRDELLADLNRVLEDAVVALVECISHGTRAHAGEQSWIPPQSK